MAVASGFELVGRENELARLRQFVDDLDDGPCGTLIRGAAGIGKTVLWRAGLEVAERAGVRLLVTRCAEVEMALALGGLGDLLDRAFADAAEELPELQRRTLAVALGLAAPSEGTQDGIALARAFVACLQVLADRSPVLVAIDDVQWLDASSQRIVGFAVKRLGNAPVGIFLTQRGGGGDQLDLRHAFEERLAEIRLGPLSVGALHHLIRTRLGVRIPRPLLARVHEASGGNPMFALEFAKIAASPGAPLPFPSSLEGLVRERVAGLAPTLLPLLRTIAAVERPTPSFLSAVVDDADALLEKASTAGAVTLDPSGLVRFTHPLLATAVYAAIPPLVRRSLHARLVVASTDPEERARHVALSTLEPDGAAARFLDEAAARAASRGAPDAAAALAEHARRLTPPHDGAGGEERTLAVATYLTDAGQMARAGALLDELLAGPIAGTRRARALLLAFLVESDLEKSLSLAEEALVHGGEDPALRVRILLTLSTLPVLRGELDAAQKMVYEALEVAEDLDDPVLQAAALMCAAHVAELQGRPEPPLLERAIALAGDRPPLKGFSTPRLALARHRLTSGDLPGARPLLENELDVTRRWGHEALTQRVLAHLFDLEWLAGNWDAAERHLEAQSQLAFDGDDRFGGALVGWRQAQLAAGRGRAEEARRLAHATTRSGEEFQWPWLAAVGQAVLGFLALSLDDPATAWDALQLVVGTVECGGEDELLERDVWMLPDAIEAAVAIGRRSEAERLTALLRAHARTREHRWATHAAHRCQAMSLLAERRSREAFARGEEAASGFEAAGFPLDHGRALLVAGEALRRIGERRRAAERLDAAKQIFSHLGAPLWEARAEKALRRAMPRPRHDRDLTSAERRVAALVATGRTNREVAAQLFTTVGTVEVHLTRIYRKLDVRSRTELARLVAEGTLDLADE